MVGGTAALPQAKGVDGGEPEEDEEAAAAVYVGHRKTKRRKHGHGDKVGVPWRRPEGACSAHVRQAGLLCCGRPAWARRPQ